jgi:sarcosine oxidase subunit beta
LSYGWDVVVIGGGMIGLAMAYHLARRQARVLLLERGDLAQAASGANAGRAQTLEAHFGLNLDLVKEGHARLGALAEELDLDIEWRPMGNLVLIEEERHWQEWSQRAERLTAEGIATEMLSPAQVRELEPALAVDGFLGAAFGMEANVNPFRYCWAYARAAQRQGATLIAHKPVTGFEVKGGHIQAVLAGAKRYPAGTVVVAAGPWTAQVTQWAGESVPVGFHYAEAMITESLPPVLNNHVGLAGFYELIHSSRRATTAGVLQTLRGNLLITEGVEQTEELHGRSTAWGIEGMAAKVLRLLPSLCWLRLLRDWGVPSSVSPDEEPIIGWANRVENLFVAGRLHLNIATLPVVSDLAAAMVLAEAVEPSLDEYSPRRFSGDGLA